VRSRPSAPVPTLVLDNRVRLRGFSPDVELEVRRAFVHENPNFAKLRAIGVFVDREWKTWRVDEQNTPERNLSVPRGGFRRVLDVLDRLEVKTGVLEDKTVNRTNRHGSLHVPGAGVSLQFGDGTLMRQTLDVRAFPSWVDLGDEVSERWVDECDAGLTETESVNGTHTKIQLRYYQEEIVRKLSGIGTMLARSPSGGGKTTAGIACFKALKVQTLVLVWSTAVQKEWVKRFQDEIGAHVNTVPQWAKKAPLSVLTCQGFTKIAHEHKNVFGLVIFDEVMRASAASFFRCVDELAATYKLGVSADERRSDGKECIIHDLFGDVEVDTDRKQLVEEGHVLDVEIRVVPWNAPAPAQVTASRAAFHAVKDGTAVAEDRALAAKVTENHHAILESIVGDKARRDLFGAIATAELNAGAKVLVLTERREQAEAMRRGLYDFDPVSLVGGDVAHGLALLANPHFRCAVGTYKAVGVGMNLPDFDVGVFVDPCHHDERNLRQYVSRLNRPSPGKKPRCYLPCDVGCYGLAPARAYGRWFERVYVRAEATTLFDELVPVKQWLRSQ
jgi:superfamily II DNA or RNA helicase